MRDFYKAYQVSRMEAFEAWSDAIQETDHTDGARFYYLRNDFVVVADASHEAPIVFDQITPEWIAFCHDSLRFQVPAETILQTSGPNQYASVTR
ncbi:hypothetical protein [Dictyobacter kobayashii]|uniref:Uncharacterized protein n=1 Tax=Dictyobacter kobayashii TaxID=2014872 RepID=A0A402AVG4_9CHLR|nr:hypothetical protein [Dictyobacter kobayashii]GCE23102.1 hypothetical protein KDK_69020 [Dictyobacter kobayashii]